MHDLHAPHWPPGQSRHLTLPRTHLFHNAEVAAARFPDKPFVVFYDSAMTFAEFRDRAERIAGWLRHDAGVCPGDRVIVDAQNSPQWMLAYYGILRADAVVVPVNPMNRTDELRHYVEDSGARVAFVAQELFDAMRPLLDAPGGLERVVVITYADALTAPTGLDVPAFVREPRVDPAHPRATAWRDVIDADRSPGPYAAGPDDLAVMPYTSGTTGRPKGCMHTHRSVTATAVGGAQWFGRTQDWVSLSVLPYFHVTGMQGGLNSPLYAGGTVILLPRWDRDAAARCIERYRVQTWQAISTMVVDFVANPRASQYDLSSLVAIRGGGAAMPEAVCARLKALTGLDFVEGYGMSETIAATHINPPHRPKPQCLGIPVYDVDARIVDPETLAQLPQGASGEIVVHGPQVMQGYWRRPDATREAFVDLGDRRFLRTGDLGHVDAEGYFLMTDRLKRMINAAGYKVWPAEVESAMYHHPAVQEACVIGARDPRRGETVKALVVLKAGLAATPTPREISDWCRGRMAAYKVPKIVEFVDVLPKSGSGKILWRELQASQDVLDAPPLG